MLEASHFDVNTAYASVDRHQLQDFEPYVYRTRDLGKTWQKITKGLPAGVYVHIVKEDPVRQGLLFAGTERGAFVSFDDGENWKPLQLNLPVTSVRDFEIYGNDLIVGDARPRHLGDRRHQPAPAVERHGAQCGRVPVQAGRRHQRDAGRRQRHADAEGRAAGAESAERRSHRLLPEVERHGTGDARDHRGERNDTADVHERARRRARRRRRRAWRRSRWWNGIPNTSPLWRPTPEPFSATAGMHRVMWAPGGGGGRGGGGGGGRGRGGAPAGPPPQTTGMFTAKLTVNGRSYTQTFNVKPDPRSRER